MFQIEQLLRQTIGLDANSVGFSAIERTVRLRMKALGLRQLGEYKNLLLRSPAEMDELIEAMVVTETWFFRDREPFQALVRLVFEEWLPAHPVSLLRILSLPCSTGEEPYSIAMSLLDAGLPPERFVIDAVDISARALAHAQRAVYGRNSFRGKDLAFRDRHFHPAREGYVLRPAVRERVHFFRGNVVEDHCLPPNAVYDFVFCRNLLIYLNRESQARVMARIEKALTPRGVCFVGAAELPLVLNLGFVSAQLPMAFACRKPGTLPTARSRDQAQRAHPARRLPPLPPMPETPPAAIPARMPPPPPTLGQQRRLGQSLAPGGFALARQLADQGRLDDAAAVCETCLRLRGPCADGYYLLGLIHDARQNAAAAIELYRKALYLNPNHLEALLQLALLLQQQGDAEQAHPLLRRADRLRRQMTDRPSGQIPLAGRDCVVDPRRPLVAEPAPTA